MIIRQAELHEINRIADFYTSCNYRGGVATDDIVICAETGNIIIGVVRLCREHHTLLLRGMQVEESFQRQGIGKALLQQLDAIIGIETCYCIPYGHLEDFYATIGFEKISDHQAPVFISERAEKYRLKNSDVIIMRRPQKGLS